VLKRDIVDFKRRFALEGSTPVLCFIAHLFFKVKLEGFKLLLRAFKIVVKKYPNAKLIHIGEVPNKTELIKVINNYGINKNVVFIGLLGNGFIPLSACDIFIQCYGNDDSVVLLEAMGIGKPVITTANDSKAVIYNENGILTDANPPAIARAIIGLYEDKAKMRVIGRNASKTVREKYTIDRFATEYGISG
jgi:glycosyltransferase involved in cell wall biosynthesis